jgi:hypothetical protein
MAADAFIYGFPLVFDVQEVDRFAQEGIGAVPATPFNQFGHASALGAAAAPRPSKKHVARGSPVRQHGP